MSKHIPGNQKHLTLEDRIFIENSLNKCCIFLEHSRNYFSIHLNFILYTSCLIQSKFLRSDRRKE